IGLDLSGFRIEQHQAALVIGDEDPAALVDLEPVRPAVVLHDQLPLAPWVDAEDAPERDVDAPQVALPIERGTLQEAVDLRAAAVRIGPGGASLLAELAGELGESPGLDALDFLERVEQGGLSGGGEA